MNWGYKILLVYLVFILGIMFLVFKSSTQKMDLVTTDYYAKELVYQQKIDQAGRVDSLSSPVSCELKNNEMHIVFPKDFEGKEITGEAILYCPSDETKDAAKRFTTRDNYLLLPVNPGNMYELHLSWVVGGISYYLEKKIKEKVI